MYLVKGVHNVPRQIWFSVWILSGTTNGPIYSTTLVMICILLSSWKIFLIHNYHMSLGKKKKILSPQKLFILILMLLLLYSFLSSLHRSCWILLRRPILKMTKEAVKNIATNFLNNITPQSMMACAHWTCCFLLCKYDRGILIGSLKCLIKLY